MIYVDSTFIYDAFVQCISHYDSSMVKFCSGVCFAMSTIFTVTSIHYIQRELFVFSFVTTSSQSNILASRNPLLDEVVWLVHGVIGFSL